MIKALAEFWESEFAGFVPAAHNFKHQYPDRWVRFHALPKSKRYPESEAEYLEVFRRHNVVLQELLAEQQKVLVVVPEYSESSVPTKPDSQLARLFPTLEFWCSFKPYEDEVYWHLHVAEVTFTGREFDRLFRFVADDDVRNIMIISPAKRMVFHPYDGGADVVLATTEQRDRLKKKYDEWLSDHPDGF